jgi:hypothetical protein
MLRSIVLVISIALLGSCAATNRDVEKKKSVYVFTLLNANDEMAVGDLINAIGVMQSHDGISYLFQDYLTADASPGITQDYRVILMYEEGLVGVIEACEGRVVVVEGRFTLFAHRPAIFVGRIESTDSDDERVSCASFGSVLRPLPPRMCIAPGQLDPIEC